MTYNQRREGMAAKAAGAATAEHEPAAVKAALDAQAASREAAFLSAQMRKRQAAYMLAHSMLAEKNRAFVPSAGMPPALRPAFSAGAPGAIIKDFSPVLENNGQGLANPVIESVSVSSGEPGAPVLINGRNFGGTLGVFEVRFLINPGRELPGAVELWTDTQILVSVPDVRGIALPYNGILYVFRTGARSNAAPFQFLPLRELLHGTSIQIRATTGIMGKRTNVTRYASDILPQGWIVEDIHQVANWGQGRGGWSLDDHRIGTNSPYVRVGVWADAYSIMRGTFSFVFNAPAGTIPANHNGEPRWLFGDWIYAW